jgi:hypothetical protein
LPTPYAASRSKTPLNGRPSMCPLATALLVDRSRDGEDLFALIERVVGGDQGAALLRRLHYEHGDAGPLEQLEAFLHIQDRSRLREVTERPRVMQISEFEGPRRRHG